MLIIYNLSIRLYKLTILLASPFNTKAKLWISGRKDLLTKIQKEVKPYHSYAWFHFPSLGEFEQGRNVLEEFIRHKPEFKIIITFFSPSGYEIRKNYSFAEYVFYLPLDTNTNAHLFLDCIQPKFVFFTKYDYWYHFFKNIHQRNIPLYLISAIFRKEQLFFKPYGSFYRKILQYVTHFFVQNKLSAELLNSIDINNYTICGDTRFDRVYINSHNSKELPLIQKFVGNNKVIVAGSTWEADERIMLDRINNSTADLKWILVPHEIDSEHIENLKQSIRLKSSCYSELNNTTDEDNQVLIIDSIGILMNIYPYAHICYIGGGFGKGIHNTLEAAAFGKAILFGPNYHKFSEAIDLIALNAAFSVVDKVSFETTLETLLTSEEKYIQACNAARKYVHENIGATEKIINAVL